MSNPIDQFQGDIHKVGRAFSDPLFFQDFFMRNGHTDRTVNGTATFVQYRGKKYACTCRHIRSALSDPAVAPHPHPSLMLMVGRVCLNLSTFVGEELIPSLRLPDDETIDVCVSEIPELHWTLLSEKKGKVAIDLDDWEPPPWEKISLCFAAGYADGHKYVEGEKVKSPMIGGTANLVSSLDPSSRQFTLFSSLAEAHGYFFSGMSGGPILATWDESCQAIGLIFEGSPSKPEAPSSFAGPNDIMIRGLLLTPERFAEWLA
jgi:hypothetical protein